MRYNFYIDIGNGYTQAYPDFVDKFKISRKIASDEIEKFFTRILWGKVQFSNKPFLYAAFNNDVYRLFDFIHSNEFSYSQEIKVKLVSPLVTIEGYFGKNDCTFDYDRKIFTVEPAVLDSYTNLLENWETDVDFTNFKFTNTSVRVDVAEDYLKTIADWPFQKGVSIFGEISGPPTYPRNLIKEKDYNDNGGLYLYFYGNAPKDELFGDTYYMFEGLHRVWTNPQIQYASYSLDDRIAILGQEVDNENRESIPEQYGDYELSKFRIYEGMRTGGLSGNRWRQLYCATWFSREETILVDEVDKGNEYGFKSPVGEGWNMRQAKIKNGKNAHLWTRKPFNGAYSKSWGVPVMKNNDGGTDYGWNWNKYLETSLQYEESSNSFDIVSTINLRDFMNYLISNSSSLLVDMQFKSTFFLNDYEGELQVLAGRTGYNYVSGALNSLNNCKIFFTKDITIPEDDEVTNRPKYKLKEILEDLNKLFGNKLTWFIDEYGNFRIEHIKWADLKKVPLDISTDELLKFTTYWQYDKSAMFETFEYKQVNAGYPDFTNNKIQYDKIISNNRNQDLKKEVSTGIFTTDVRYCVFNPNDLKDGLVLITTDNNNVVLNSTGLISNVIETNGLLSLSYILNTYCRYEGIWHTGILNGYVVTFTTTERNKLGTDLKLKGYKNSLFYTTQIGVGLIDEGEVDFDNENTLLKLRYRYNSSINGDTFALVFQDEANFQGALNVWADIDNYTIQ